MSPAWLTVATCAAGAAGLLLGPVTRRWWSRHRVAPTPADRSQ